MSKKRRGISRTWQYIGLAVLAVVAIVAVVGVLTRQPVQVAAPQPTMGAVSESPAPEETSEPVTFAAVGDSITEVNSPDFPKNVGDGSWVSYATGDELELVGGWADGGAQTATMATNVEPVKNAKVLAIIAGTNDVSNGIPYAATFENLQTIAETVGAPHVVISTIPPLNEAPQLSADFNDALASFAEEQGWELVDAMAAVRRDGVYAEGMTADGVHPTQEASRIIGEAMREAILNG